MRGRFDRGLVGLRVAVGVTRTTRLRDRLCGLHRGDFGEVDGSLIDDDVIFQTGEVVLDEGETTLEDGEVTLEDGEVAFDGEDLPFEDGGFVFEGGALGLGGDPEVFENYRDLDDGIFYALSGAPSVLFFDQLAVDSLVHSGLPVAAAIRQLNFANGRSMLHDLNGRIFRHRAGLNAGPREENKVLSLSKDGKTTTTVEPSTTMDRWEIFVTGNFGRRDLDEIDSQAGFESDSWSGTVGAEYHLTENLTFGAAYTYGTSDVDFSRGLGGAQSESSFGSVYFSYAKPQFYADVLYSYGVTNLAIDRRAGLGLGSYESDTDAAQHYADFNTGYNFVFAEGKLLTGPTAGLNYLTGDTDAFRENNSGSAALSFDEQNYDSLVSKLGWQVSFHTQAGFCKIVPQLHASWAHEFLDDEESVRATLISSPFAAGPADSFSASTQTAQPGTDYLAAGAGIEFIFGDSWSVNLGYEGEFFREDDSAHYASIRAGLSF